MKEEILSPVTGIFCLPTFADGDTVQPGDTIGSVESMKMYFPINTETSGVITYYLPDQEIVQEGQAVAAIQLT